MIRSLRLSLLLVSIAWAALAAGVVRADVVLVENGQPKSAIVVDASVMAPDLAAPMARNPAREDEVQRRRLRESVNDLALTLEKLSGARVPIVTNAPAAGSAVVPIYVGAAAGRVFGRVGRKAPYRQGFRVAVSRKGVGLFGESDLAASYAIYELLDRLGCRWFMPGARGEVIPALATIALKDMDLRSAPGTIYRGLWYADEAYKRRNRCGGLLLSAGHALEFGYLTKDELAAHPDWVATSAEGKPIPGRLKWSSQGVADAVADKILAANAKDPQPSYSLSPDDGATFDQSPEDRALDAGDFDTTCQTASLTDRLMVLANRIAKRVTAREPDVLFGILAYVQYTRPPVREKVHPNVVPQIAPITYARAHPMSDDAVPGNKELRYTVEGWAKKAKMTSYYFYGWFLAEPVAPNPMLSKWGHDVPYVLQKGNCKLWQPETVPNFETSMHALYMSLRLAWDPTLKPADVFREINEKFYGAAAKEMTAYWEAIDRTWVDTPEYSGCGFGYLRRWTPERLRTARELMNAALAAARTDAEKFRVGLANDSLALFEAFMKLRVDQAEGRFANLAADADAWVKRVLALAEQYKDEATFTRVGWTPHTVDGGYFLSFYNPSYQDASRVARDFSILTQPPLRRFRYLADPDLKGEAAGYAKADFDDTSWKTTDVAVETWSTIGLHDYFKSLWYRATVDVPAVPAGKKVFLWLGSTDGSAKVFVNGQHVPYVKTTTQADKTVKTETVPAAEGYCQPFSFDITAAVKAGAANRIAILCTRTSFNELGTGGLIGPAVLYAEKP